MLKVIMLNMANSEDADGSLRSPKLPVPMNCRGTILSQAYRLDLVA